MPLQTLGAGFAAELGSLMLGEAPQLPSELAPWQAEMWGQVRPLAPPTPPSFGRRSGAACAALWCRSGAARAPPRNALVLVTRAGGHRSREGARHRLGHEGLLLGERALRLGGRARRGGRGGGRLCRGRRRQLRHIRVACRERDEVAHIGAALAQALDASLVCFWQAGRCREGLVVSDGSGLVSVSGVCLAPDALSRTLGSL